jgi:hypothetical protein
MQRVDQIIQYHSYDAIREDKYYYTINTCDPDVLCDEHHDVDNDLAGLTIHESVEHYITESTYMTEEDEQQECLLIELECQRIAE